ncbi:MAG: ribonuclease domain-containing protein [Oscillospiraceae bacterium]
MKKLILTLAAAGMLLFTAACSNNAPSPSGAANSSTTAPTSISATAEADLTDISDTGEAVVSTDAGETAGTGNTENTAETAGSTDPAGTGETHVTGDTGDTGIAGDTPDNTPATEDTEQWLTVTEDGVYTTRDDVALYIHLYGHLPENFITKKQAQELGWNGGSLEPYAPGKCIGGNRFGNYEGLLPEKSGRTYTECDIDTLGANSRGAKRIVFSNDGLIYYTDDHYESFTLLYGEE